MILETKNVIPFLLAILIVPVGMAYTQTIPGEEDFTDDIGSVGNTGAYLELLKQQEEYQNMTDVEKEIYIQRANEFISSDSPYDSERNYLLEEYSRILLKIQTTSDATQRNALNVELTSIIGELEDFGVVSSDTELSIEDIADNYFTKKNELENPTQINNIHTNDLLLQFLATCSIYL